MLVLIVELLVSPSYMYENGLWQLSTLNVSECVIVYRNGFVIASDFCVLLQSLRSRGYVKDRFSWQHYYYYLTNEGMVTLNISI